MKERWARPMRACALLAGESRTFLLPVGKSQPFERKKSEIPSPSLPCCHKCHEVTFGSYRLYPPPLQGYGNWSVNSYPSSQNTSSSIFARRSAACSVPSRGSLRGGEMCAYSYSLFRRLPSRCSISVDHRLTRGPCHGLFARASREHSRGGECTHKSTQSFPRGAFRYVPERRWAEAHYR